jgi:hypothetical protein
MVTFGKAEEKSSPEENGSKKTAVKKASAKSAAKPARPHRAKPGATRAKPKADPAPKPVSKASGGGIERFLDAFINFFD